MSTSQNKSAIIILAARINILFDTLSFLYKNFNNKHRYPVLIYTFGQLISEKKKREINDKIDITIKFFEIYPQLPSHIKEEELYYNRTYLEYVRKKFDKKRIGFLHMCHFLLNLMNFDSNNLIATEIKKYQSIMWIDDETYFKKKINENFFSFSEKFPLVTATWTEFKKTKTNLEVTENMWEFYVNYVLKNNIEPKSKTLKEAIVSNNKDILHKIDWPCGAVEIFNTNFFQNDNWKNYLETINYNGGVYKHRWNPSYLIALYLMTFYDNPIYNLDYIKKDIIDFKIAGSDNPVYYNPNVNNSKILRFINQNIIEPIKIIKKNLLKK
jgi:hypothetical protein